jgi:PAS domain S-box-containing protein
MIMDPRETKADHDARRSAIEQEHARILVRLFGADDEPVPDPQLAARYLELIRGIAGLSARQLLGLRFLPEAAASPGEFAGAARAEEAEAAEELALIRRMADASGDGFAVADARGELTYANPTLCRMFGEADAGAVVGVPMVIYLPEEQHAAFRGEILPAVLREGSWVGELPVRSRQGGVTPAIQAIFVVHRGHGDGALRIAARVLDLTESKRLEAELRDSEMRYRELVETIDEVVVAVDPQGVITYISPAIEKLTGATAAEAQGYSIWQAIHPDDRALLAARVARLSAGELLAPQEYRILRKDGGHRWARISTHPIMRDGRLYELRGTIVDIHDRRIAEEALRESEGKYRDLVETIDEGIFALDPEGGVVYMSPGIEKVLGYRPADMVGHSVRQFIHPDDLPARDGRAARLSAGEPLPPYEFRIRRKDGAYHWVRISTRPIMKDGRLHEMRGTLIDIQARKEAEEALRESEAKYIAVVEQAQIGVAIVQDGVIRYCNEYGARMVGLTPAEMTGRPLSDFVDPGDRETQAEIHRKRMRGEPAPQVYRAVGRRRDGSTFRAENRTTLIQYGGRPAALAVIRDLTE